MQRTRTSYDRQEARRDRRYPVPTLLVAIAGREHASANWSLGGFMLVDWEGGARQGDLLEGVLRFEGSSSAPFKAEIMRVGPAPGEIGARFRELPDAAFDILDRGFSRKLFRPRAGG